MKKICLYVMMSVSLSGCASILNNPVAHESEAYDYEQDHTKEYMDCVRRKKKSKAKIEEPPCRLD